MGMVSATEAADRWARNLAGATQTVTAGVDSVTESPTSAAARQVDLWQQRMAESRTRDRFVRGLQAVTLEDWKQAMRTKGIPRIAQGANASKSKMQAFMQQWLPFVESIASRVRAMPKATLEDRIQRAVAQIRGAAEFRRS